jgi:hypothetical protein
MAGEVDNRLALFEVPRAVVEPLLRSLRMANTAADAVYYDVGVLWLRLFTRGVPREGGRAEGRTPHNW